MTDAEAISFLEALGAKGVWINREFPDCVSFTIGAGEDQHAMDISTKGGLNPMTEVALRPVAAILVREEMRRKEKVNA